MRTGNAKKMASDHWSSMLAALPAANPETLVQVGPELHQGLVLHYPTYAHNVVKEDEGRDEHRNGREY